MRMKKKEGVVRLKITSTDFILHNIPTTQYNGRMRSAGYPDALRLPSWSADFKFAKKWN